MAQSEIIGLIVPNIIAIVILLTIFENARHSAPNNSIENRVYFAMLWLCFAQALAYIVSYVLHFNNYLGSYWFASISNAILYFNNAVFAYLCAMYVTLKLCNKEKLSKKFFILISIPSALMALCSIVNVFTPLFFEITTVQSATGLTVSYSRSSLFFIPVISSYLYLVYSICISINAKRMGKDYLFFPVLMFLAPTMIGVIIESIFTNVSTSMASAAIALNSVYINLQRQSSSTDQLSGLFTREMLTTQLVREIDDRSNKNASLYGIMLDIDNFKKINDTYGHVTGDHCIETMGKMIRLLLGKNGWGFRYAGDEFVILIKNVTEKDVAVLIEKLKKALNDYFNIHRNIQPFTFSCGYMQLDRENDDLNSFIMKIDMEMYKNKPYASGNR